MELDLEPKDFGLCSFSTRLKMKNEINFDVGSDSSESQPSHLIYFDVRFRMSAKIHADSLELAVDKIYDTPERDLLNFNERDAPEITISNVF
jgi:hypothetical protein